MKSYPHIERYVREWPWAIQRGTLEAMLEALALAKAGVELTPEELEERVKGGAGQGSTQRVGSVAVIPIYGVVMPRANLFADVSGGTSLESFRSELDEAVRDQDVRAIALDVNSPGGSTELLTETAGELRAARAVKPVVAVANTLAASAAYHLGSQASELFVTPSGYAGAVGVYSTHEDLSGAQEQAGVKTTLIHAGRYKVEGNPYEPLGEEARGEIQRRVDAAYDLMVADIAAGRNVDESSVRTGFGQGRTLDAKAALSAGMVDGVQTFDATIGALLASGSSGVAAPAVGRKIALVGHAGPGVLPVLSSASASEAVYVDREGLDYPRASLTDDLEAGLAFLEELVTSGERLASVPVGKRDRFAELALRAAEVVARTEPVKAGENLEAETTAAMTAARLSVM